MRPVPVVQQPEHGGIHIAIVFFGFFCMLTGYLIFRSPFLPKTLGVLTAISGLGWLSFLSPALGNRLFLYVAAFALLVAAAQILWLFVFGVDEQRWKEQASAGGASMRI